MSEDSRCHSTLRPLDPGGMKVRKESKLSGIQRQLDILIDEIKPVKD